MHIKDDWVEAAARAMYGKGWDGPPDKMPGEKMKDVWRGYSRAALEAVAPRIHNAALEDAAGVARWASTGETAAANILAMREPGHANEA
jgi:hypothetical protein